MENSRGEEIKRIDNAGNANKMPYSTIKRFLNWVALGTGAVSIVGNIISYIGLIPSAIGFINGITSKNVSSAPEVSYLNAKLKLNGTIESVYGEQMYYQMRFPNSSFPVEDPSTLPNYKNTLGVFHIPYTPKLKKTSYKIDFNRSFTRYYLENPVNYLLNPASGVKIVNLKVALEYKLQSLDRDYRKIPINTLKENLGKSFVFTNEFGSSVHPYPYSRYLYSPVIFGKYLGKRQLDPESIYHI